VDELTGLSAIIVPLARHAVPPAGWAGWIYVFGSATLFAFILQVLTGAALASGYVTGSGQAYESLLFLTRSPFSRFVRGVHAFGASAMIILIGLHTIRVYLTGSYKFPRQINWLSGAALLLLTLGMAFTGQLLRWDQIGFWTAVVAAEQAGRVPLIGNWLGHFILAGDVPGGATLSRFFATHVFYIPALIFPIIGFHVYLVLHNGISELPRAGRPVDPERYRRSYRRLLQRAGEPFWPDAAWRDILFGGLIVLVVAILAFVVGPPELGRPPDPTLIDASPRPDWYFLWYFAVLSTIPNWLEYWVILLGPLLFGLVLVLLPFVAGRGERSPLRRPWAIGVVLLAVGIIAYYSSLGVVAPWSPRFNAQPLSAAVVGVSAGPVADGARLFYQKGCEYCHMIAGEGGIRAPDLTTAGDRLTPDQMKTRIYSGAANMPSYIRILTPEELDAILAFLQTRTRAAAMQSEAVGPPAHGAATPAPSPAAAAPWQAPADAKARQNPVPLSEGLGPGKASFERNCRLCHGSTGKGDGPASAALSPRPTDLASAGIQAATDGELFWKISTGRGAMPAWQSLPERERWSLVDFIRGLAQR
jgi:ubiquinol-cytochrome c reductase cytochrome b subunit